MGHGHINPILPIVRELSKTHKVIVYSLEDVRTRLANVECECRIIKGCEDFWKMADKNGNGPANFISILKFNLTLFDTNSKQLMMELDIEKPDLIIQDDMNFFVPVLMKTYKKLYAKAQSMTSEQREQLLYAPKNPLGPLVNINTTFTRLDKVFPKPKDKRILLKPSLNLFPEMVRFGFKSWQVSKKYGTSLKGVMENNEKNQSHYGAMICPFIREIQPSND